MPTNYEHIRWQLRGVVVDERDFDSGEHNFERLQSGKPEQAVLGVG